MKKFKSVLFFVILSATFFIPDRFIFAAAFDITSDLSAYRVGDEFEVNIKLNAGDVSVNAVSGEVEIPSGVKVLGLRYGHSIVPLWINRPEYDQDTNKVTFTGGIPGGFNSRGGTVVSIKLLATQSGRVVFGLVNQEIALNDGTGDLASVLPLRNLEVKIEDIATDKKALRAPLRIEEEKDTMPPESFVSVLSSDDAVYGGKYFIAFNAVDKNSGVDRYEIRESLLFFPFNDGVWVGSESPYVLRHQIWPIKIEMRAFDRAGNYSSAELVSPSASKMWPILLGLVAAAVLVVLGRYYPLR